MNQALIRKKHYEFAKEKHGTQKRIGGDPYITHPVAVADILKKEGYDIEYQIVALFHDLLEDTDATEDEIRSRYEVKLEKYTKLMNIEVRTMKRMTRRTFLPAINKYATLVANEINEMKAACAGIDTSVQDQLLNTVVDGIKEINDALNELHAAHLAIRDLTDEQEKANKYAHEIVPMMERLRAGVDAMEIVVAHDLWPVPTYNDILFYC